MEEYFKIGIGVILFILWFWAFFDILKTRFKVPLLNTICLILLVVIPVLVPILYMIFRKKLIVVEKRKFRLKFNRIDNSKSDSITQDKEKLNK